MKKPDQLNCHMIQVLFCLCLKHLGLLSLAVIFDILVESLKHYFCHLWTKKIKAAYDKQTFLKIKLCLAHNIEGFVLLCDITLFLLKSLFEFLGVKTLFIVISIKLSSDINLSGWYLQVLFDFISKCVIS